MLPSHKFKIVSSVLVSSLASVGISANPANAVIVGVDFGTPGSSSPNNWTLITGAGTTNDLVDELGNATNIDIEVSSSSAISNFNASVNTSTIPISTNPINDISGNLFSFDNDPLTITFSDLVPNQTYNYFLFGVRDGAGGLDQSVSVNGINFTQTGGDSDLFINGTIGSNTDPLSSFAIPVTADASGNIVTTVTRNTELYAVAGIALENSAAVPFEFSPSLGLVAVGGLFGLNRYRKRKRSAINVDPIKTD